jgi:DNA-binding response OmpR family regulator/serine phosphatase RsbU (regulator of sigma subunit)
LDGNGLVDKATILVVDDAPDGLMLVNGILKDAYRVKVANRGEKALAIALSDTPPDLILLDVMMPEMNGYEVCERLKADDRAKGIPVIFLTAKTDLEDEEKGLKLGAVDYITKPISPPILLARVETHLKLKASQDYLRDMAGYLEKALAAKTASLEEARAKLAKLVEVGIALASEQDSDLLVAKILESAKELTNAQDGVLYRRNERDQLEVVDSLRTLAPIDLLNEQGEANNDNMIAYAVNSQTTVNIEDASTFLDSAAIPHLCVGADGLDEVTSVLVVPLKPRGGDPMGALQLVNARKPGGGGAVVAFLPEIERFVEALAAQAATALHNRELLADARYRLERLHVQQEMENATRMQQALLPQSGPLSELSQAHGLLIQSHFQPSSATGGDLWGIHEIDAGRVAFYAFDFTGHGLAAALNTFRLHALIHEHRELWGAPNQMLMRLDAGLCRLLPPGHFATIFYGVLDMDRQVLEWSAGGAPNPIFMARDGSHERLETRGVPLGLLEGQPRKLFSRPMLSGESVMFYSDGMSEATLLTGGICDDDGVDALLAAAPRTADGGMPRLDVLMKNFQAKVREPLDDDLTAVLISRR